MPMTHTELRDAIEAELQDSSNSIFSTTELDTFILNGLSEVSYYSPRQTKESKTTTEDSKDLTLSDEHKRKLIEVWDLEYPTGCDPLALRNFTRWGDVLTMDINFDPDASETVYLYLAKKHICMAIGTSDLGGALSAAAALGATSLALNLLGTGTINEDTVLVITGDTTEYTVTANATISGAAATVSITPALVAAALINAVVTLSAADSSLDPEMERLLIMLVSGRAAISKARSFMNKVNVGGGQVWSDYMTFGRNQLALAQAGLRAIQVVPVARKHPVYDYSTSD